MVLQFYLTGNKFGIVFFKLVLKSKEYSVYMNRMVSYIYGRLFFSVQLTFNVGKFNNEGSVNFRSVVYSKVEYGHTIKLIN